MPRRKQVLALASLSLAQRRPPTPAQSRQRQTFYAVGIAWAGMNPIARCQWQALANQMTHHTGLRTPAGRQQTRPMTAFQAFASLGATQLACGRPLSLVPPSAPDRPNALPPMTLTAQAPAPDADGAAALGFTLTLTAPAYEGTLQVYAAPPLLAGQRPALGPRAAIIALPGGLAGGPNDLADAYQSKFGPLVPGQQVVLTLVPVSPSGFKGAPLLLAADVAAPAPAARPALPRPALLSDSPSPVLGGGGRGGGGLFGPGGGGFLPRPKIRYNTPKPDRTHHATKEQH